MKRFIFKLGIFAVLFVFTDIAMGNVFRLYDYAKGGEIHKIHTIMTKETPDLVIMGSSRACHHYNPAVFEDSLHLKTYNAGLDGRGIPMAYGLLAGLSERKFPKYIVCEISRGFDLMDDSDPGLKDLYPYVQIKDVKDEIESFNNSERWKLLVNSYRLNSSVLRLFPSIILKRRVSKDGFYPISGHTIMSKSYRNKKEPKIEKTQIHPQKEKYLRKFIETAKSNNCKLIFAISPVYEGSDLSKYNHEIEIINSYAIPIINHLNDSNFINTPEYFKDKTHMNCNGAEEYSKIIMHEIKAIIGQQAPITYQN